MVEIKVHIQGPRTRHVFNLISNVKINQLNSVKNNQPVRLAGGWWLVLICSERKVLLAGWWWLVCSERKVPLGWWLISQANRANDARDDAHVCVMTRLIILGCYNKSSSPPTSILVSSHSQCCLVPFQYLTARSGGGARRRRSQQHQQPIGAACPCASAFRVGQPRTMLQLSPADPINLWRILMLRIGFELDGGIWLLRRVHMVLPAQIASLCCSIDWLIWWQASVRSNDKFLFICAQSIDCFEHQQEASDLPPLAPSLPSTMF
jgi:hypothetical protein